MQYKSIVVNERGGPDKLTITQIELRPPGADEVRIRTIACSVCQDDVAARVGNRPFLPKLPFVPGYAIIGEVDALGEGADKFAVGDRVAALIGTGGYSEMIYLPEEKLTLVPPSLDPAEAVTLVLNYLTAYQAMHQTAKLKAGDTALVIGASGGVGTAFLQLGRVAGLKMYGLASGSKAHVVEAEGAIPIDYRTQDFVEVLHNAEPDGIDFVFNGMAHEYFKRGLAVLRRGGVLVHYGAPQSMGGMLRLIVELLWYNLWPNGKRIKGYGTHRVDYDALYADLAALFRLLEAGAIKPVIAGTYPLLEAAHANELLESGQISGNLVLLAEPYPV